MTDFSAADFETIGTWTEGAPLTGALLIPIDPMGRVLLQLRDYGAARYPGQWGFFGGKVEAGETLTEAMVREFQEEAGVAINADQLTPRFRMNSPETRSQLFVFQACLPLSPSDICLGEGAGFAFVSPKDFAKLDLAAVTDAILTAWRAA